MSDENKKLSDTFDEGSREVKRTAEEWRAIEKANIERDARNRGSSYVNPPKAPGLS